jgi:hypothetical protein
LGFLLLLFLLLSFLCLLRLASLGRCLLELIEGFRVLALSRADGPPRLCFRHGDSRLMQPHKAMRVLQLAICCCFAVPDGKAQLWLGWVSQALSGEGSTAVRQARRSMECFYGPRDGDKGRCSI